MLQNKNVTIKEEIASFIENIANKYNKKLQIIVSDKKSRIGLSQLSNAHSVTKIQNLESLVLNAMHINNPEFKYINSLSCKTRRKEYIMWMQVFSYVAWKIGYTKSYIGKFIDRNHASVIHSIKQTDTLLEINDKEFVIVYNIILNLIKKHVGIISTDTSGKNDSRSVLNTLRNQEESIITIN
tara:strand:- start:2407 stop:2955 length:549 start_codon:yes stop_codon:yes gene_type:complete